MIEMWDAYDKYFNKIENIKLVRGESIPDGMYHLVCDIIVKHIDNTYLLMKRDFKKHHGGMWELTSGGSALVNETPIECAMRELKEETGINSSNLEEIGRFVDDKRHTVYVEYLCVTDCDKDSIILQEGETIAYKWVDKKTILAMNEYEFVSFRLQNIMKDKNI